MSEEACRAGGLTVKWNTPTVAVVYTGKIFSVKEWQRNVRHDILIRTKASFTVRAPFPGEGWRHRIYISIACRP